MATTGEILVAKRKKVSLKLSQKNCLLTTNFVLNLCSLEFHANQLQFLCILVKTRK